ncbi:putative LRR containing protein [Trachipleistophora hominis]|uniref:Putative LRR containing protein n=1 Tax=Trachipleistophora hominis TaxID=72359 RepID=L7JWS5_TRAHO|nr:putative LRR containing protein [Trachipleistophora hominis]
MKVIRIVKNCSVELSISDMCIILEHWLSFKENAGAFAHVICFNLQCNQESVDILDELKACIAYPKHEAHDKQIKKFSNLIFRTYVDCSSFIEVVRSQGTFFLKDGKDEIATCCEDSHYKGGFSMCMRLTDLNIGFLFANLYLEYNYFIRNKEVLFEKFGDETGKFALTVRILDIHNKPERDYRLSQMCLDEKLRVIMHSRLINSQGIKNIMLSFRDVKTPPTSSTLLQIKKLSTIRLDSCSTRFLHSLPIISNTNVEIVHNKKSVSSCQMIPRKLTKIFYIGCIFTDDIRFPSHLKYINIKNSKISDGNTLFFHEKHEEMIIFNTYGMLVMLGTVGFGEIFLSSPAQSSLKLIRNPISRKLSLSIEYATIFDDVNITEEIEKLELANVKIQKCTVMSFSSEIKQVILRDCIGLIDLRSYLGGYFVFIRSTTMSVFSLDDTGYSSLVLRTVFSCVTLELTGDYHSVTLDNIIMENNSRFIINASCKKLTINTCDAIIDVSKVVRFDMIHMIFTPGLCSHVQFVGISMVTSLKITNFFENICSVITVLSSLTELENLRFTNSSAKEIQKSQTNFPTSIFPLEYEDDGNERLLTNRSDIKNSVDPKTEVSIYGVLKAISCSRCSNKLKKLEFNSFAINLSYLYLLESLPNLQILNICVQNMTKHFFQYLPQSLLLLDIRGIYNHAEAPEPENMEDDQVSNSPIHILKILVIDTNLLSCLCRIAPIFPHLKVVKIHYVALPAFNLPAGYEKIKVSELIVEGENGLFDSKWERLEESELMPLIELLSQCFDMQHVEYFLVILGHELVNINPRTFYVIDDVLE